MAIITLPVVKMLLVAIMLLGLLVEIKTGGMGAGVLLGIVAAGVFWGSQYVQGAVSLYMIAVFFGGILCIIIEMLMMQRMPRCCCRPSACSQASASRRCSIASS